MVAVKDGFVDALSNGLRISALVVLGAAFVAWRFLPARAHDPLAVEAHDDARSWRSVPRGDARAGPRGGWQLMSTIERALALVAGAGPPRPAATGRRRRGDHQGDDRAAPRSSASPGLSMDVLAQRAGVGKATIYRRWDSKEAVILHALRMSDTPIPTPDEGNLRADLCAYLDAVVAHYHPGRGRTSCPT